MPTEAFSEGCEPTNNSYMVIKAPGANELEVSLAKPPPAVADDISVWEWSGSALDEGDEAAKWFTNYLGKPSRLVRFNAESEKRAVDPEFASGHNVMFSDLFPYMMISQPSLDALNQKLKELILINRFRPKYLPKCSLYNEMIFFHSRLTLFYRMLSIQVTEYTDFLCQFKCCWILFKYIILHSQCSCLLGL